MDTEEIAEIINAFEKVNILVIGDIMLDKYVWGEVNRISYEAPVEIVEVNNETSVPGGAANVANNIVSLGAKATIAGIVGDDEAKNALIKDLKERGINTEGIITDKSRPTTTKKRVISQNQQLIRIDYEKTTPLSNEIREKIINFVRTTIDSYDLVIISDYSKGIITKELMDCIKQICNNKGKKIIADPKPKNMELYKNIFMITPNHLEACRFAGVEESNDYDCIKKVGESLQKILNTNVIITRGKKGVALFEKGKETINIPTKAKEVYDITGAGDTALAVLALSIASGSNLKIASIISNYAAGIVVEKFGTATINSKELLNLFEKKNKKIKDVEELKKIVKDLKSKEKKIVWTNGCFDILHSGHTQYLQDAKKLGDILIVGLNSDSSVKKLKGNNRPIMSETERAEILSALECVDYITFFNEDTPINQISAILPNIIAKGGDYKKEDVVGKDVVEGYDGKVIIIPFKTNSSTSKIIKTILKNHSDNKE